MKKISKFLSFILGASMAIGINGSISANAIYMQSNKIPMTTPDGEVVYELDCEKGELSYRSTAGDGLYVYGFEDFRYNDIRIKVKDGLDRFEMARKYLSEVSFNTQVPDVTSSYDGYIWRYDKYVSGDDPRTHESVEDKYKQLSEICAQMYEDGVIEEAVLSPAIASYYSESLDPMIDCGYLYGRKEDFQPLVDEIQALVDKYTEYGKVSLDEYGSINGGKYYICINLMDRKQYITDFDTYDKIAALRDEIDELYDFENVSIGWVRPADSKSAASAAINLLDPYICDIDGSGKADITDATAILTAYAESAAGLQKAAADDKMDVNGDGEINIEDATYVLTYYAEVAAGIR
ncbi:MAG: hypothetical protein K2H01_03465 [Ruminococcus sp.]|nr:hypothetical protein [Ruminococcus sp.]